MIREGFLQSTFAKSNFMILLFDIKKDKILPNHNHIHTQFGYCFKGSFNFTVMNENYEIKEKDTYLLKEKIYHSAIATEDYYSLDYKYINNVTYDYDDVVFDLKPESEISNDILCEKFTLGNTVINKINNLEKGREFELRKDNNKEYYLTSARETTIKNRFKDIEIKPMNTYELNLESTEDILLKIMESEQEFFLFEINNHK